MNRPVFTALLGAVALAASVSTSLAGGLELALARSQQSGLPMFVMGSSDT